MTEVASELFSVGLNNKDLWEQILSCFSNSRIFHTWQWAQTFAEAYAHVPRLICLRDKEDIVAAIPVSIVKRPLCRNLAVSMPYSDFAGPLFREYDGEFLSSVVRFLGTRTLEVRADLEIPSIDPSFFSTYRLDLPGSPDELYERLPQKSVRYSIRKAVREGLTVAPAASEQLPDFYRLVRKTRQSHGIPTPPMTFFNSLFHNLIDDDLGVLLLARDHTGLPVAASLFLWFREMAYYKYSASDPSIRELGPGHLLLWEGIKQAISRGCSVIDLGRVSASNPGLASFKRHWLGEEVPLRYFTVQSTGEIHVNSREGSISRGVLGGLIRNTPPIVSGLIGRIIYRYFS